MPNPRTQRPEPDDREPAEAPVRKKKKKKRKENQAPSRWPMLALMGGVGVVGLMLIGALVWAFVNFAGGGPPAPPVADWAKFSTEEEAFGFEYPARWGAKGYGIRDRREAEVKGNSATITIKENLAGSLVGDIANAADAGRPVDDDFAPVAKVHDLRRPQDSSSYKEEPAVTVMTRFGKARRSAYTDGSRRGYRATVLMRQTALDVFCDCRATDWDTLRPAFERVIESLGPGGQF